MDGGFYYRGPVNTTERGQCEAWADIAHVYWYDEHFEHVGLEGIECRNTVVFEMEERPWCFVKGLKVFCDIPKCPGNSICSSGVLAW